MKQELDSQLPVELRIGLNATASKDPAANALHWCKKRKRFVKALEAVAESALTESALAGRPFGAKSFGGKRFGGKCFEGKCFRAKPFAGQRFLGWRPMRREQLLQHPMRAQDLPAVSWRPYKRVG